MAHIVFFKERNRFFFGCDASTKEKPCRGPKEWQRVDVPDELRKIPDELRKIPDAAPTVKTDPDKDRKRTAGEARQSKSASSGEEDVTVAVKHVKQELN